MRTLICQRVQVDEVWCFFYAKDKNLPDRMRGYPGVGSMWTWTARCADTKLVFAWKLGSRDVDTAKEFMQDVQSRLANRIQLSSDGYCVYLEAVEQAFGSEVDYAMLVKQFGKPNDKNPEPRHSPGICTGAKKTNVAGDPDPAYISTSFAERQNLNIRMQNRRYTRLTNDFRKKAEMLAYSIAITFMYHNFVRIHLTLKSTPAMKAGVAARKWDIGDMVDLLPELKHNTRPKTGTGD